ncbi:hypothetical protein FHS18_003733 [Paenibacillus phyllosphaerae]|uniref:Uncharacterized protein n=1 Tax=Paenibacillus phyllosphaerae TaxID=274593 RepID=A0A7W5AZK0_9BACL|nr:hypothetical protein [Paenibacillus phyllosphaerae]MBB3111665.1 hypothetical protein [Paenibacillus phyllosphaerae]
MSMHSPNLQEHTIYQANTNMKQSMKSVRDHIHHVCKQHVNRYVRVETLDGDVFEGVIVHCDKGVLYLKMPGHAAPRGFTQNFHNDVILPLVLYELLVITLMLI